jgi:hypothetical protein
VKKLHPNQWAGIAGIGAGLLFFASAAVLPLNDFPASDAAPDAVAGFIKEHRGGVLAGIWMNSLGSVLLAVQISGLRERLGDAWSRLGMAAGLVSVAIFTTGFAGLIAAAYRVDTVSPEAVQLLADFAFATFAISSIAVTVSLGFYAASIFATRRLPAWLGWAGIIVAALHVIAATAYAGAHGALSLEGQWAQDVPPAIYLWSIAAGVAMLRARDN